MVTSTALWPSGCDLKGSKATLLSKSVELQQVPCGGKTPVVSVGRFSGSNKGCLTEQGESSEGQKNRNSYFPLARVLFDCRAGAVSNCISSDAQAC